MTKVNPSNGNEPRSDSFPWGMLNSDIIYFMSKNIEVFQ